MDFNFRFFANNAGTSPIETAGSLASAQNAETAGSLACLNTSNSGLGTAFNLSAGAASIGYDAISNVSVGSAFSTGSDFSSASAGGEAGASSDSGCSGGCSFVC